MRGSSTVIKLKKKKKHHQGQILFAAFHHGIEMPHSSSPG